MNVSSRMEILTRYNLQAPQMLRNILSFNLQNLVHFIYSPDCKNYDYDIFKSSQIAKIEIYSHFVAKMFTSPDSGRDCCGKLPHGFCVCHKWIAKFTFYDRK